MTIKVGDLFGSYQLQKKKSRRTERGDLLLYFCEVVNKQREGTTYKPVTPARMGYLLSKLQINDLYHMKSYIEDLKRTGGNPSKWFWWSIKGPK